MKEKSGLIWANLLQLGENMWNDRNPVESSRFDERVWEHVTDA